MKKITMVLILFYILVLSCFSQDILFKKKSFIYEANTLKYKVISYEVKNKSDNTIIFWLQKNNNSDDEKYKIRNYFFNRYENDFCFADLINGEMNIKYDPILYYTFIKQLSPNESFIFIFFSDHKYFILEEEFTFVKKESLKSFFSLNSLDFFLYKKNNLIIVFN